MSLGESESRELLTRVHSLTRAISSRRLEHVLDVVPSYLAVTVFYDALTVSYEEMKTTLLGVAEAQAADATAGAAFREHRIEVRYDGEDLATVAERTKMSIDEVVRIHSSQAYTVDLLGFVPGFAYLSELPASLRLPRRGEPRPRVSAGTVAIAGAHTGVYPLDTPGGWHLLGHTDSVMFDALRSSPALLEPGDVVRFVPA